MNVKEEEKKETFDKDVFLDFIVNVKESFLNQLPLCPVSSREEDSSLYSMPDGTQLLFSVSN